MKRFEVQKLVRERNQIEKQLLEWEKVKKNAYNNSNQKDTKNSNNNHTAKNSGINTSNNHSTATTNNNYSTATNNNNHSTATTSTGLLEQVLEFRRDYLKNGGRDVKILNEISEMENEILNANNDDNNEPLPPLQSQSMMMVPAAGEDERVKVPLAISNPLMSQFMTMTNDTTIDESKSKTKKLELEILEMDLLKDRLIAQHELRLLENDLKQEQQAMTLVETAKQKQTAYPLDKPSQAYNARNGFIMELFSLQGYSKYDPNTIQINCALFDGQVPLKSLQSLAFTPNSKYPEQDSQNLIKTKWTYNNVAMSRSIKVLIDIRFHVGSKKQVPFGWTSFELFRNTTTDELDVGSWSVPLYMPPINFKESPYESKKTQKTLANVMLNIQIGDSSSNMDPDPQVFNLKEPPPPLNESTDDLQDQQQQYLKPVLRPETLMKKKRLQDPDAKLIQPVITKRQEEKQVKPEPIASKRTEPLKKFAMGFQLTDITNYKGLEVPPLIRFVVIDTQPDNRIVAFTSSETEAGVEEGSFGWQFGSLHEIGSITGIPKRKGLFEIIVRGLVVGSASIDIFKFQFTEAYDINDGIFSLTIVPTILPPSLSEGSDQPTESKPILRVRIYKPKFGPPPIQKFVPKLITPPLTDEAYMFVPPQPPVQVDLKKLISITITIDAARFLPGNVTVCKIIAKVFSRDRGNYIRGYEIESVMNLDESVFSPTIMVFKDIPAKLLDSSCCIVYEVYTLEFISRQMELVGCAIFELFNDQASQEAGGGGYLSSKSTWLNYGSFQIPLFHAYISKDFLRLDGNIQRLFRVPCASLLIRVLESPIQMVPNKKIVPPDYESKVYATSIKDAPRDYEELLYQFVMMERKRFSIRDRLLSLGDSIPKTARHTEDSLIAWLSKKMEISPNNEPPLINPSYIAEYDPKYGFKLSIDSATNLQWKGCTFAITSFTPSIFVLGERMSSQANSFPDQAVYTKSLNYGSDMKSPVWNDGYHWYRNRPLDRDTLAIIQLLSITINPSTNQVEVQSQGWTLLSVFIQSYVRHGYFHLPLFEGYPSEEAIQMCWKDGEYELEDGIHSKAVKFTLKYASIFVRLCDGRRGGELNQRETMVNTEFLGGYKPKFKKGYYGSPISSLKGKKQTMDDFDRQMQSALVETTGLPYIP